jgi:hypothetical protein
LFINILIKNLTIALIRRSAWMTLESDFSFSF